MVSAAGPSLFFAGMSGCRMPIATAHGEGRAVFDREGSDVAALLAALCRQSRRAHRELSLEPSGRCGATGFTTADGRRII